ncbi:hypothetical protein LV457_16850 [Mycobacterium sp. MYCO198283]|uniref:hypothetical protein n=1 Tax=Mycobacterium sp. MYCO198283 TaxID=2883505 RepID=UPI001E2F04B2|nr:hypothetical protein [Mycobacterium sp. MYCO198283]MCG5433945.1 hypothetical protein [Mycobacterium sp. MYCO198283]
MNPDALYLMSDDVYTFDELVEVLNAEAATLPEETWRCGWDVNDYIIEAMQVGIIESVEVEDEEDALRCDCW